jgi:carbon-monoxide dehydrogenase small subunit
MEIELTVNGTAHRPAVEPRRVLADALRDDLGLTGTKLGCEHGVCGSCTVEGLADADGTLDPLQAAFSAEHARTCAAALARCTPGLFDRG